MTDKMPNEINITTRPDCMAGETDFIVSPFQGEKYIRADHIAEAIGDMLLAPWPRSYSNEERIAYRYALTQVLKLL